MKSSLRFLLRKIQVTITSNHFRVISKWRNVQNVKALLSCSVAESATWSSVEDAQLLDMVVMLRLHLISVLIAELSRDLII